MELMFIIGMKTSKMSRKFLTGVSWFFLPALFPKTETELKVKSFRLGNLNDARLIGKECNDIGSVTDGEGNHDWSRWEEMSFWMK